MWSGVGEVEVGVLVMWRVSESWCVCEGGGGGGSVGNDLDPSADHRLGGYDVTPTHAHTGYPSLVWAAVQETAWSVSVESGGVSLDNILAGT